MNHTTSSVEAINTDLACKMVKDYIFKIKKALNITAKQYDELNSDLKTVLVILQELENRFEEFQVKHPHL